MHIISRTDNFLSGFASSFGFSQKREFDFDITKKAWSETGKALTNAMQEMASSEKLTLQHKLKNDRK